MGEGEFTQGPWEWVAGDYGYSVLWNPKTRSEVIATGGFNDGDSPITWMGEDMRDGDKTLIAAAPDLYNALWEAVELLDRTLDGKRTDECQRVYDLCRAALKKAEGE